MSADTEQNLHAQIRRIYIFHLQTLQKKKKGFPILCAISHVFCSPKKSEIVIHDCGVAIVLFMFNYEDNMIHMEDVGGNNRTRTLNAISGTRF